jgi:hypothetical protein
VREIPFSIITLSRDLTNLALMSRKPLDIAGQADGWVATFIKKQTN